MRTVGIRKSVPDDLNGTISVHSAVLYENDEDGNLLIADPWDGLYQKPPEAVICAMVAAQIECDSQCFQVFPSK